MKRPVVCAFIGGVLCLFVSAFGWAQATAQISGTVKDQTGAVLPGVEVTATQTDTGIRRAGVTNETGSFVLTNLAIGPYRLEASLPGFRTYTQTGIVLQVNGSPVINPILEVGQVTEQVEVQANAALVETRTVGVGQVVENARILELPLNGRNVTELIALSGASTPASAGINARNPFVNNVISVAGGVSTGLNYTLDGANHNNPFFNTYYSIPFPDALQEFKVETSAMSAQTGTKPSGTVSLVTKSGTNEIHGDLFEFVRNGIFNARNAFATKRDTIKRNQFGGTIGGPIRRNKLFFFSAYQGTRLRQDPADIQSYVPNAAILSGDFTVFASPACNGGRQITLRSPFANNRVDPALFSKAAVAIAKKLPQTSDRCGLTIYGNRSLENDRMIVGKIDYQKSPNHSIFGRYIIDEIHAPAPYELTHNELSTATGGGGGNGNEGRSQAFTLGDTYLIGPNIVNSFRLTGNRLFADKTEARSFGFPDVGVKMFSYAPYKLSVTVSGGFTLGSSGGPSSVALIGLSDDLSVLRGNHQMAFGVQTARWWSNSYSTMYPSGRATFNGQTTGLGMADFFLGNVSLWEGGTPSGQNRQSQSLGVYGADTWKVNQRLAINYGLRWEPFFPLNNVDGTGTNFDFERFKQGIKSTYFVNAPPGLYFPHDPGYPGLSGMYKRWWNFSPRLGLAWDVNGDGRTSVRASAGTFFDYPPTFYLVGVSNQVPYSPRVNVENVKLDDPWANYSGGDPFPIPYGRSVTRDAPFPASSLIVASEYDTKNTVVNQWNLSLQRQIGADWLISATYLGNNSSHLWSPKEINPAVFLGTGPCTLNGVQYPTCSMTANTEQRRRLTLVNPIYGKGFGTIVTTDSGGTASYNGLLLSVQRQASRGVTISSNYTWSHCITDPWGTQILSSGWNESVGRRNGRGNCSAGATDRRHVFNLSAVATSPDFSRPALRILASGWRLSPIYRVLSGGYMSVASGLDRALVGSGVSGQRADQVLPNPYGDKTISNYLNPAAFAQPALGTIGNVGTASIAGPGSWQFDLAVSRTFQITEVQKLEFRAEAFNVTNGFRMNNPNTSLNSNTFGKVTSAQDPRIMQFALKYFF
jgi:Carboxypeptidase regulatory-like domain/TonB dependent receptor